MRIQVIGKTPTAQRDNELIPTYMIHRARD